MSEIKAGIITKVKFVKAKEKKFDEYIDYINRDEAIRERGFKKYSLYTDYMEDSKKANGLFTDKSNNCTKKEKEKIKEKFAKAQKNGSLMWQIVVSFDTRWLEEIGIYDSETGLFRDEDIKQATRKYMKTLQKGEDLENAIWTADIHYNTDNFHVHIAMVEEVPKRKKIERNGKKEIKGRLKQSVIDRSKSAFANDLLKSKEINLEINEIIRNKIIRKQKETELNKDKELSRLFIKIYNQLPSSQKEWNYNGKEMKKIRPLIDKLSMAYLEKHNKKEYNELEKLLDNMENKYKVTYGEKSKNNMKENKIKDLKIRLGNSILKQMKEYDKAIKRRNIEERLKEKEKLKRDFAKNLKESLVNKFLNKIKNNFTREIESMKNQDIYKEIEFKELNNIDSFDL